MHSDVCNLHSTPSRGEKLYFVTFTYDFSKFCYVYLMRTKDEVLEKFKIYMVEVENLCNIKIKCLRRDKDGEYHFPKFCEDIEIVHETLIAYTP